MAEIDIKGQLKSRPSAPLEHYERRRVIVWHDPDGEFADEFAAIVDDPSSVDCTARGLRVVDAPDALRYEVGAELAERLSVQTKGVVRLDSMKVGHYSLDRPGLVLANQGDGLEEHLAQVPHPRYMSDDDGFKVNYAKFSDVMAKAR